jgi:hypothetical protein
MDGFNQLDLVLFPLALIGTILEAAGVVGASVGSLMSFFRHVRFITLAAAGHVI